MRRGTLLLRSVLVVALLIGVALVLPHLRHTPELAIEAVLRSNLLAVREALMEYEQANVTRPKELRDLVAAQYLRRIPEDPVTGHSEWDVVLTGTGTIADIRSKSSKRSTGGTVYSSW